MVRIWTLLTFWMCILCFPLFASADTSYISLNAGYAITEDIDVGKIYGYDVSVDMDNGYSIGLALGHGYESGARVEIEILYQSNDYGSLDISHIGSIDLDDKLTSVTGFYNMYYDFKTDLGINPFISAGLGWSYIDADFDTNSVFAYQAGCGLSTEISESTLIDLKYRYFATDSVELQGDEFDYRNHIISIGIRSQF